MTTAEYDQSAAEALFCEAIEATINEGSSCTYDHIVEYFALNSLTLPRNAPGLWMETLIDLSSELVVEAARDMRIWIEGAPTLANAVFTVLSLIPGGEELKYMHLDDIREATMGWRELKLLTELIDSIECKKDTLVAISVLLSSIVVSDEVIP